MVGKEEDEGLCRWISASPSAKHQHGLMTGTGRSLPIYKPHRNKTASCLVASTFLANTCRWWIFLDPGTVFNMEEFTSLLISSACTWKKFWTLWRHSPGPSDSLIVSEQCSDMSCAPGTVTVPAAMSLVTLRLTAPLHQSQSFLTWWEQKKPFSMAVDCEPHTQVWLRKRNKSLCFKLGSTPNTDLWMLCLTDTCAANTNAVTQKLRITIWCNFLLSWPTVYIYSNHSSFLSFKEMSQN